MGVAARREGKKKKINVQERSMLDDAEEWIFFRLMNYYIAECLVI